MVNNYFQITQDTKLLRHEQTVELSSAEKLLKSSKQKKIVVCLTAKDSDI